jgi:hypothetical protein
MLLWFFIQILFPKVYTIKLLGLCSGVVEWSILLGGGAAPVGDWRPNIRGKIVPQTIGDHLHSDTAPYPWFTFNILSVLYVV